MERRAELNAEGETNGGAHRQEEGVRHRPVLYNLVLAWALFALGYSALSGIVPWTKLHPRLPEVIFPFETWPMFKFMLRSEAALRLEGEREDGERVPIPKQAIFAFRSLEGRTVLDHTSTVALLQIDYLVRSRRIALARAISESEAVQEGDFKSVSVYVDNFDVHSGEVFATIELMRIELGGERG